MAVPIKSNQYKFPAGYRGYVAFLGGGAYVPWNGYNNGVNSPNAAILGAVVQFVATGVPTDLQVMTIFGPDGKAYKFQFLYNGTAGNTPDAISVPLPNSGASTAAQVMTALTTILNTPAPFNQANVPVPLPWVAQTINSTTTRINLTIPGNVTSTVAPANITITVPSQQSVGKTGIGAAMAMPASLGKAGAFLPGP